MSFGLCDRTEQEWVEDRPRNGTTVGEPCGDGTVSGHRDAQQEVVGGQSPHPWGTEMVKYVKASCFPFIKKGSTKYSFSSWKPLPNPG